MRTFLSLLSCFSFLFAFSQSVPIVPLPQSVFFQEGQFQAGDTLRYFLAEDPYGTIGENLDTLLPAAFPQVKKVASPVGAQLLIGTFEALGSAAPDTSLGEEGYQLSVTPGSLTVAAHTQAGVFYGVQSLAQLLRAPHPDGLPCMEILDWPAMPYRGVMDDISRGPLPNMEYMKSQIRRLAGLKVNMMTFYIEHVVKTRSHPAFAPPDGITIEEWQELSAYAARYHVQLMGSFQSLGHFRNILVHPKYEPLGLTERMLYPAKPEALTFLREVYDELLPAFNGPFFNINCDETWDLGRGETKALADSIGTGRLYASHVAPLLQHVLDRGKRPMMWGDMALEHLEVLDHIPKETIILAWDYDDKDTFYTWIDPFRQAGFDLMACPGVLNSNRMMPNFGGSLTNIREFVTEAYEKGAMGVLNTVWDDGGRHFFSRDWYAVAYGAEQSWHPNFGEVRDYDRRLSRGEYGMKRPLLPALISTLNEMSTLPPTQGMNNQVMWQQVFPDRGSAIRLNMDGWTEIGNILDRADSLLQQMAQSGPLRGEWPYWRFTVDQYRYLLNLRQTALASAALYRKAAIDRDAYTQARLDSVQQMITRLHRQFNTLTDHFTVLWQEENRGYWTDIALGAYHEKQAVLRQVLERMFTAKSLWMRHAYLPPPRDMRLDIKETGGQYFAYWMITGPFLIDTEAGPHPDFLANMGGESQARPDAGEYFTALDGQTYMWDKYASPRLDQVDLIDYFTPTFKSVAYVYCRLHSPEARMVKATLGSNDGIVVFCNGEKVWEKFEKRSLIPDEDTAWLPLQAGWNHLLLKVDQWKGDWGFSFRLPDETVRNQKYRYYIQPLSQ